MSETVKLHLVLDFHDAVLYPSDIDLLESPTAWLNDSCMHFYLTVLQQRNNTTSIAYMDPAVISFIMHQCDDLDDFLFPAVERIVIPINDGHAPSSHWSQPGRGSHWSLLVIKNTDGIYWHLDSVSGCNRAAAYAVAEKCQQILGHCARSSSIVDVETPQQDNGYDCGLHALCAAELVSECENVAAMEFALMKQVCKGFGKEMRQRVLEEAKRLIADYSSP